MTETSCSMLTKEWFEDSSSEEDGAGEKSKSHCRGPRRLLKKRKTTASSARLSDLSKKVQATAEPMVELRVTLKVASKVASKAFLTAHVCGLLKNRTLSSVGGRSLKKKGRGKIENWRKNPVRAREHGPFGHTLPGELSRAIIGARVMANSMPVSSTETHASNADSNCLREEHVHEWRASTRKEVKAARKMIRETEGLGVGGLLREHPSLSLASHNQIANVIAKCLPLQSVAPFISMFDSFRPAPLQKQKKKKKKKPKKGTTASPIPAPPEVAPAPLAFLRDEKICKTPIEWIDASLKHAFGNDHVMLKRCQHPDEMYGCEESHSDLDLVVMDCVLARTSSPIDYNKKGGDEACASDTPVQVCSLDDVDAVNLAIAVRDGNAFNRCPSRKEDSDEFYRACIVLLPQAGVFYCHRERRSVLTGVLNSHVPMDINWLRLKHGSHGNFFGNGSFVSRLAHADKCSIWKWSIRRSATNLLPFPNAIMGLRPRSLVRSIHCTKQLTDEEGPGLPPDYIVGEEDELLEADLKSRAETFQDAFSRSRSAKRGGRHYAPGFLHKTIDPSTTFVIDPIEYGELDLHVDVTIPSKNKGEVPFHRRSVVQIRHLPTVVGSGCAELLIDINRHCKMVGRQRGRSGARAGNGDLGAMHPIGCYITKCWNNVKYVTSSSVEAVPVLLKAVQAAAKLAAVTIPTVLRVIQDFENDSGMQHVGGMDGGICRVTLSMDLSINLANSTHYDVNDASQGFTIWTEDCPGTTGGWYFVLPNMKGKFPGTDREYNGIAIKLSDGVLIGWDGRLIRHGTSMVGSQVGNIHGTFFAAKTRIIKYGMSQLAKV